MAISEATSESPTADRAELQSLVSGLFLQLLQQLHADTAEPWLELEVSMPQLKMLFVVDWVGPAPMSQVAARLGIGVSAASGLAERLEEHGLARREHDSRDRRVVRVASTEAGRELVVRLRSAGSDRLGKILARLSAAELRRCAGVIETVNRAAEAEFRLHEQSPAAEPAELMGGRA